MNHFAKGDLAVFRRLFDFDFGPIEQDLGIDCFLHHLQLSGAPKRERTYNRDISLQVLELRHRLADADAEEMFSLVTDYYRRYGYGVFAANRAFRVRREAGRRSSCPSAMWTE